MVGATECRRQRHDNACLRSIKIVDGLTGYEGPKPEPAFLPVLMKGKSSAGGHARGKTRGKVSHGALYAVVIVAVSLSHVRERP